MNEKNCNEVREMTIAERMQENTKMLAEIKRKVESLKGFLLNVPTDTGIDTTAAHCLADEVDLQSNILARIDVDLANINSKMGCC